MNVCEQVFVRIILISSVLLCHMVTVWLRKDRFCRMAASFTFPLAMEGILLSPTLLVLLSL